jgi:hypothetical protein
MAFSMKDPLTKAISKISAVTERVTEVETIAPSYTTSTYLVNSLPVKTNDSLELISSLLDISDVDTLPNVITDINDRITTIVSSNPATNYIKLEDQETPSTGKLLLYANATTNEFHQIDDQGNDTTVRGEVFDQLLNSTNSVQFSSLKIGTVDDGYTLPTTRGALNQIMKSDGSGVLTFQNDTDSFDQDVNTTNNVEFSSVTTDNITTDNITADNITADNITIGTSSTSYTLPTARGALNQIMKSDGSGVLTFQNDTDSFDQDVNTTNNVEFSSVTTDNITTDNITADNITIGTSSTSYTLPTARGALNQIMKSDGSGVLTFQNDTDSFDQDVNTTDSVEFSSVTTDNITVDNITIGTSSTSYTLPTARGALNQIMKSDGSGVLTFQNDTDSFDQDVNTTDSVEFSSVTTDNITVDNITIGTSSTSYTLPTARGALNQIMKSDGSGVLTFQNDTDSFDQDVNTTNNVEFKEVNVDSLGFNTSTWKIAGDSNFAISVADQDVLTIEGETTSILNDNCNTIFTTDGFDIENSNSIFIDFSKFNGTLASKTNIGSSDNIGGFRFSGYVDGSFENGGSIFGKTTDTWDVNGRGLSIIFATTKSDETVPQVKMSIGGEGVYINDSTNAFLMPTTRGTVGQVLKTDGAGLTTFETMFNQELNTDDDAEFGNLIIKKHDDSEIASLIFHKAKGTIEFPTGVLNGDRIGKIDFQGRNSDGSTQVCGSVTTRATESFTTGANGTSMIFRTVDNTTDFMKEKLTINSSGVTLSPDDLISSKIGDSKLDIYSAAADGSPHYTQNIFGSEGSLSSPITTTVGDTLYQQNIYGYASNNNYELSAQIEFNAKQLFTVGSHGSTMEIKMTPSNGQTPESLFRLDYDGLSINDPITFNDFKFPTTRGTNGQIMIQSNTGDTNWGDVPNESDQELNTINPVQFYKMTVSNQYNNMPTMEFIKSKGTPTTQTPIEVGDELGIINFIGRNSSGNLDTGAKINCTTLETFTSIANGTSMEFSTCDTGSSKLTTKLTLDTNIVSLTPDDLISSKIGDSKLDIYSAADAEPYDGTPYFTQNNYGSRGNLTTPVWTQTGHILYEHNIWGWTGGTYHSGAQIQASALQNWSGGNHTTRLDFNLASSTNTIPVRRLRLDNAGVHINESGNDFSLPLDSGTDGQVMVKQSGTTTAWVDGNISDQLLITTNPAQFTNLTIDKSSNGTNSEWSPGLNFIKRRGNIGATFPLGNFNHIANVSFSGLNDSYDINEGARIESITTESFTTANSGTNLIFATCNNGSNTLDRKILLDSNGITINNPANSIALPTVRGTVGQVLKTDGDGLSTFETMFDQELNKTDEVEFSILTSKRYSNDIPSLIFNKCNGTVGDPDPVLNGDRIGKIDYQGLNSDGSIQVCGNIITRATENFTTGVNGVSMKFSTVDNTTNLLKEKLTLDSDGVIINEGSNSITLPTTRGLDGQVLQTDADGILYWHTPFVPSFSYYETGIESIIYNDVSPELVSNTHITIAKSGLYHVSFSSQVALRGTISQQLIANLVKIMDTINALIYTPRAAAYANETLTGGGNYYTNSASGLTGSLTLSGSSTDVFVIYINGAFTLGANASIVLADGTRAENVFFVSVGALTMGTTCTLQGTWIGKAAMTFTAGTTITKGRVLSNFGNVIFNDNTSVTSLTDDTSDFIKIGALVDTMIFNIAGDIDQVGTLATMVGSVITNAGSVENFGVYDGTFTANTSNSDVLVSFTFYVNNLKIERTKRFLEGKFHEHDNITLCCIHTLSLNDVVSVYIQVVNDDTSSAVGTRCLYAQLVQ